MLTLLKFSQGPKAKHNNRGSVFKEDSKEVYVYDDNQPEIYTPIVTGGAISSGSFKKWDSVGSGPRCQFHQRFMHAFFVQKSMSSFFLLNFLL